MYTSVFSMETHTGAKDNIRQTELAFIPHQTCATSGTLIWKPCSVFNVWPPHGFTQQAEDDHLLSSINGIATYHPDIRPSRIHHQWRVAQYLGSACSIIHQRRVARYLGSASSRIHQRRIAQHLGWAYSRIHQWRVAQYLGSTYSYIVEYINKE